VTRTSRLVLHPYKSKFPWGFCLKKERKKERKKEERRVDLGLLFFLVKFVNFIFVLYYFIVCLWALIFNVVTNL